MKKAKKKVIPEQLPAIGQKCAPECEPKGMMFWVWRSLAVMAVLGTVGIAVSIVRFTFFSTWTDENIHLYVANRWAEGSILYRDIHSARPPLALLPLTAALWAGISPLWAARILVFAANLTIATILSFNARKEWGKLAGAAAFALYLLAPEVVSRSTYTGIHIVALGTTCCVLLTSRGSFLAGGVAGGLALASGQHALVLVGMSGLWAALVSRKALVRFLIGSVAVFSGVMLWFWASAGADLWTDLVGRHLYHFDGGHRAAQEEDLYWWLKAQALDNYLILFFAVICAIAAIFLPLTVIKKGGEQFANRFRLSRLRRYLNSFGPAPWWALFAFTHILVVMLMKGGLALYLFPAWPLLILLASGGFQRTVGWAISSDKKYSGRTLAARLVLILLIPLVLLGWTASRSLFNKRDHMAYPLLPHQRSITMANLQHMVVADQVAQLASHLSSSNTVFGYPTLISLVAVRAGLRVSGELADLAPRWIKHGSVSREDIVKKIEADKVGILATPRFAFVNDVFFRGYLQRCYEKPMVLRRRAEGPGRGIPDILVFYRSSKHPCR